MREPKIVIVDYGVGNTRSVSNAINALGYTKLKISADDVDILNADALILPGVGAFEACAKRLRERHLDKILNEAVLVRRKCILGICVGMQLMATESEENGTHAGLDWISGRVVKFDLPEKYTVPHVGWNNVRPVQHETLLGKTGAVPNFYFDHSYHYKCDPAFVTAEFDYGIIGVTAAINKNNIYGVQFHPEKSQNNGLRVFRNFFNIVQSC